MNINQTVKSHTLEVDDSYDDEEDDKLNFTIYNYPKNKWIILPNWQLTIKITTFIPVILFGIISNFILINIIFRNRSLRTPINLLIANMSIADTLTLIICPILFMFHDFFQNYQLGMLGCKLEGFIESLLLLTAVLNLCAISYDRLTAIVLPLEAKLTINGSKIIIVCTWVTGFILSTPLAIYRTYEERIWKDFIESYCKENATVLRMYWHVLIVALVWFPLGVMVLCYSAIFHKLDRYEKKILKRENPLSISYKKKVAKMLFIIVIIFVLLRMPFNVLVFIRDKMLINLDVNQVNNSFRILWYTSHYLIFLNAAINPIIYGLNNDNFRRAYHQTPILPFNLFRYRKKFHKNKIQKTDTNNFVRILQNKMKFSKSSDANIKKYFICDRINNLFFNIKHQNEQNKEDKQQQIFQISSKLTKITNLQLTTIKIENQKDTISKIQYKNQEDNYPVNNNENRIINLQNQSNFNSYI